MNNYCERFCNKKNLMYFSHIGIGVFFVGLPTLSLILSYVLGQQDTAPSESKMALFYFRLFLAGVFYLNYFVLVPKVLNKKGMTPYFIILTALLGSFILFTTIIFDELVIEVPPPVKPIQASFPFVIAVALGISIRFLTQKQQEDEQKKERELEYLKSELTFLRSQISPHFLFNIMNNVVALSRLKPHLVEPTLIKMSHLLRYMLYDTDEQKGTLGKEIEYLESYFDLQRMRFGGAVELSFEKKGEADIANAKFIEPMLLIPFVENAFKHGTGMIADPYIRVSLNWDAQQIHFTVANKYDPNAIPEKEVASGIGLKNVLRRLELLHPDAFEYARDVTADTYEVRLSITV